MNGGSRAEESILQASTLEKMFTLQIEGNDSQGLCWHKMEFESMWGHGGGDPGISTLMYFSPIKKTGIIIFQNSGRGTLSSILEKIYRLAEED